MAVGLLSAINTSLCRPLNLPDIKRDIRFLGVVTGEEYYPDYKKLFINIDKILLKSDTIDYRIPVEFFSYQKGTMLGKRVIIKGRIRPYKNFVFHNLLTGSIIGSYPDKNILHQLFFNIRSYIEGLFKRIFAPQDYDIATGLVLGGSGRLSKPVKEVFRRAGVLHILAVSGLHVGFVIAFLGMILIFIPVDNRIKFLIIIVGLFIYAGIIGFRPSVCRAGIMAFLFGLGLVLQRNVEPLHIINITAMAFLTVNPMLLFDVGTELSFSAVYGIIILYPELEKHFISKIENRFIKAIISIMAVSLSAQLFALPLISFYFHKIPTLAVFSNVLIVPLVSVIIFMLYISVFVSLIWMPFVHILAFFISQLIFILLYVGRFFASVPGSVLYVTISPIILLSYYLLFFKRTCFPGIVIITSFLIIFSVASFGDKIIIKHYSRGLLITTPVRENIFIAKGSGGVRAATFLDYQGLEELDYLIAARRFYRVKKRFVKAVDPLHFKHLKLGRLRILLSRNFRVEFNGRTIFQERNDGDNFKTGWIEYIVSDGNRIYKFNVSPVNSIFNHLLTELKLLRGLFLTT